MKHNLSILVLLFILLHKPNTGITQTFKEVDNKELAIVLAFVEETKMVSNDNLSIKAYKTGIPSDTISNSKSEELYNRIFLCISEVGEFPKYKVFELTKLYNVSLLNFYSVDPFIERFEFISGKYKERKINVLELNIKAMTVVKIQ